MYITIRSLSHPHSLPPPPLSLPPSLPSSFPPSHIDTHTHTHTYIHTHSFSLSLTHARTHTHTGSPNMHIYAYIHSPDGPNWLRHLSTRRAESGPRTQPVLDQSICVYNHTVSLSPIHSLSPPHSLPLSLPPSLPPSLPHTYTHTHTYIHTHSFSLSPTHAHTHTHTRIHPTCISMPISIHLMGQTRFGISQLHESRAGPERGPNLAERIEGVRVLRQGEKLPIMS